MREDTAADIQKCLACPLIECANCLENPGVYGKKLRKHAEWKARIKEYAALGLTDKEMASRLAIHPNTVMALRKELGIPRLRGGTRGD